LINKEDKELLLQLSKEYNLDEHLNIKLVEKIMKVRYQDKVIGLKDEISDIIKLYANKKG